MDRIPRKTLSRLFSSAFPVALALAAALWGPSGSARAGEPSEALAAFDRFRGLEGSWIGTSTKGWKERVTFSTIAGRSVVVEGSLDAHPGEAMQTVVYLDGGDLVLTHYCVAKNQPHLKAASFADGGRTVEFVFAGGGNLADRNRGHMDRAVFRFDDPNHVTERWTWYENGSERWLEEIQLVRAR